MDAILQQVQKLPTSEKLNLVQALWDDIAQSSMPIPASEKVQVDCSGGQLGIKPTQATASRWMKSL